MNIILFGPPGAGKGTQSKYLVNKLKSFQISTGDLLREEIKKNTDIGKAITNDMKNGKFISDDIVNKLIENLISDPQKKNKLIFDGYPRSLSQATNLEQLLKNSNQCIDLILFLNVDKETILKRIEKRKIIENRSDDNSKTIVSRYVDPCSALEILDCSGFIWHPLISSILLMPAAPILALLSTIFIAFGLRKSARKREKNFNS